MKAIFTVLVSGALLAGASAQASEPVELDSEAVLLGFGNEAFLKDAIVSDDGSFNLTPPRRLEIQGAEFRDNFDLMCELSEISRHQVSFSVGPSSAEESQCHLDVILSNGQTVEVTGAWASGE